MGAPIASLGPPDPATWALKSDIPTQFVAQGPMHVADLLTNFPASATYLGKYARVDDLYGWVDEVLRCRWDGTSYRWVPQRVLDFAASMTTSSGTINVTPLVTPPVIILKTNLTGALNIALSNTNAWIGQCQRIRSPAVLGINVLQITGLVGGLTRALVGGGDALAFYTAAGWES